MSTAPRWARACLLVALLTTACTGASAPATPTPTATLATPTPSATPRAPVATATPEASPFGPDARYGIVVPEERRSGRQEPVVRSETDARPIATLSGLCCVPAGTLMPAGTLSISPDSRRVAYWREGRLELWDAATPDRTATLLAGPPEGETGTGIVWAPDGEGLLLSFHSLAFFPPDLPPGPGRSPAETVLRTLDLGSGQLTEVARAERTILTPVAWDRAGRTVAAVESRAAAPYAETYLLVRDGHASRTALGDREATERGERIENVIVSVVGSPDASRVVAGVTLFPHGPPSHIVSWPLAEPERVTELRPEDGRVFVHHGWLPRSTRVIVADRPGAPYQQMGVEGPLFLWDAATGDHVAIPDGSTRGSGIIPRADGTALYVMGEDGATSVLDIASGERKPLPDMPTHLVQGERRYRGVVAGVILR